MSDKPVKKAAKPKKPAAHPAFKVMIKAAVQNLADRKGSSRIAIKKYIVTNYKVDESTAGRRVTSNLRKLVATKQLAQVKGSFKLDKEEKPKKKPKAQKPKAKKPKAVKTKKPKVAAKKPKVAAKKPKAAAKKPAAKKPKAAKPVAKKPAKSPAKKAVKSKKPKAKKSPKKSAKK